MIRSLSELDLYLLTMDSLPLSLCFYLLLQANFPVEVFQLLLVNFSILFLLLGDGRGIVNSFSGIGKVMHTSTHFKIKNSVRPMLSKYQELNTYVTSFYIWLCLRIISTPNILLSAFQYPLCGYGFGQVIIRENEQMLTKYLFIL